jgi:hypothetical protein
MTLAFLRGPAVAIATCPLLLACGGSNTDHPAVTSAPPCSGPACNMAAPPALPQGPGTVINVAALCPVTADIVRDTFLGGTNGGEVVSLNIDATTMTYTLKWLESPVPLRTGNVTPTRAGTQITGAVIHPLAGALPTDEQIRCTFILGAGTGTGVGDGQPYTTPDFTGNPNPPTITVGQGTAAGGTPGATVQFGGVLGLGVVNNRHFDFFPFFGFANTSTDITKLPGTYNGLLYHLAFTANYATVATNSVETLDASGNCTSPSSGGCLSVGNALTLDSNGYFDSTDAPQIIPGGTSGLLRTGNFGIAHLILGQINGETVPLVVRTGSFNTGALQVDDESGIAMLAPATAVASGGFDGSYIGADSNFKYTTTSIQGGAGTFMDPSTSSTESGFGLTYGLPSPGLVGVLDSSSNAGFAIASGGVYAIEIQGPQNGGLAPTSANSNTLDTPYFAIATQSGK